MIQASPNSNIADSDELSTRELIVNIQLWIRYLLSKWVLIFMIVVLGAIFGYTYAFLQKPTYKAELSFALEDDKGSGNGLGAAMGLASQFGIDLGGSGGGAFSGDNLLELMKSRSMVEKALLSPINYKGKIISLANLYINDNKLQKNWSKNKQLANIKFDPDADRSKFTLQQDSILGVFYNSIVKANLSVSKVDKKLSIITVKVTSGYELFSKYFAESLVKTVSDFYVDTKTKRSVQNVQILQRQTDSVRRELNSAISGVASSADNNPNANPALQILRAPSQRRQVDVQANTAILTELVKNLEISRVSLRKETPLIQIIDRPILPLEMDKFGKGKGIIIGGLLGGFLIVLFLTLKELYLRLMAKK